MSKLMMYTCKECGQMFIPGKEHLYKLIKNGKTQYYCSYKCWVLNGGDNGRKHNMQKMS